MDFKLKKSNLNFRVYTAAAIPTTGTENDIVIISEVPMSNWILSPDKPSGIPRSDGDVWIRYSVNGDTFNALKNNSMMIATISAWQYVDGAWGDVTAMSYQDGEWVEWAIFLVNGSFLNTAFAGEWMRGTGSQGSGGSAEMTADGLKITGNGVVNGSGGALRYGPEELIDFTEISEIIVEWEWVSGAKSIAMLLVTDVQNTAWNSAYVRRYDHTFTGGLETTPFDVSDITGEHYFRVGTSTTTSSNIVFLIRSIEVKRG